MIRKMFLDLRNIVLQVLNRLPIVESSHLEPDSEKLVPWGLPSEIVNIIFRFLSYLDRACFALSCKKVHEFYVSYNKKHAILVLATLPGKEFLLRLQNERWTYCDICQNLHRTIAFRLKHLKFNHNKKCSPRPHEPTILNCVDLSHFQHLSQVDICPCSSMTFHQKHHIVEYFRNKAAKDFENTFYSTKYGKFYHLCTFEDPRGLARVIIKTKVSFNQYRSTFWVENQFTFHVSKEKAELESFRWISPRLSRHDTENWIKDFFREAQSEFCIGQRSSNWYQCHGWDHSKTRPYTFMILLNRNLGGTTSTKGSDKAWEHNCYYQ